MKLNYLFCLALLIMLSACENSELPSKTKGITPKTLKISGSLAKYLEIIEGDYEVSERTSQDVTLTIGVKQSMSKNELYGKLPKLSLKFLDSNGSPISGIEALELDYDGQKAIKNLLINGEGEEIVILTTIFAPPLERSDWNRIDQFVVSSSLEQGDSEDEEVVKESEVDENEISLSPNKFDKAIDELEIEVDKYVKFAKKNKGTNPIGAMTEYTNVLVKIQQLVEASDNEEETLTPSQMARIVVIQAKMAEAQQHMVK